MPSAKLVNGEYHLNPAAVLILIASTVYGSPLECGPDGYSRATRALDSILEDATRCGFKDADRFRLLVAHNDKDRRIAPLAAEIVSAIEAKDTWLAAMRRAGFSLQVQSGRAS